MVKAAPSLKEKILIIARAIQVSTYKDGKWKLSKGGLCGGLKILR